MHQHGGKPSLFSKFKTAINNCLLLPFHRVVLAFSGGPSSRVALEYLLEIREKAQRDAIHCNDGSAKVFGFGVAHVNESSILPLAPSDPETLDKELRSIVMEEDKKPDEFLNIPLESVYSDAELDLTGATGADPSSRRERLQMLLKNVADPTGKEDLLKHLRMQALQQAAKEHGYTRLVLGLSTSRIAAKVISETAKQGCSIMMPDGMYLWYCLCETVLQKNWFSFATSESTLRFFQQSSVSRSTGKCPKHFSAA